MPESNIRPKPRVRIIIDDETGAKVHPDGLPGYIGEMSERATQEWQTLRQLVPDFPAMSLSPIELIEKIQEQDSNLKAKISKKEMGVIEIQSSRPL